MASIANQITARFDLLPYKQEVTGSSPVAPTTPSTTYEPSDSPDTLPEAVLRSDSVPYLCPECRERDSFSAHAHIVSNLLTRHGAQGTHSGETAIRPHVGHTEAR